jgi:hypothetical protein
MLCCSKFNTDPGDTIRASVKLPTHSKSRASKSIIPYSVFGYCSAISRLCRVRLHCEVRAILSSLIKRKVHIQYSVDKALGAFWPGRDTGKGAFQLRGWAGELRRAAGSRRVQTVPASGDRLL